MKDRLIDILACPVCTGDLSLESVLEADNYPWREILQGNLVCQQCYHSYPIVNGIPRMTIEHQVSVEVEKTVDGFGYEWETFNDQIQNTYMSNRENFFDFIYPVTENFFQKKIVLDAGCGMGRFLKLGAEFGSREIIGMDLSRSVEAAYQNTCHLPNAHVVQGDIMSLPFKQNFEYIFCIGVLQFLSQPQSGFQELIKILKPGGLLSIWVYSKENNGWVIRFLSPLRKKITSHLPRPMLHFISHLLGLILFVIIRLVYKPANEWYILKRIGCKLPYNTYLYYNLRLSYIELSSIIFDHLVPSLVVYLSKEEILDWFKKGQLKEVKISSRNNMSWRACGSKNSEITSD